MSAAATPLSHTFLSSLESSMEPDMTSTPSPAQPATRSSRGAHRASGAPASTSAVSAGTARQTFLRALHSEWIKLRTLRSTWVTAFIALLLTSSIGAGFVIGLENVGDPEPWQAAIAGIQLGQVVVAVLGVLAITSEYSSGQIRSTLAAVPRRARLLLAKAAVISLFSFVLGALSILIVWAASVPFVGEAAGSLTDSAYLGFIWGTGLAYTGTALLAMGFGFLTRSTAGGITIVLALLFIVTIPINLAAMQWEWVAQLQTFLPQNLAIAVYDPMQVAAQWGQPDTVTFIEHWQACLGFALWALVPMTLAAAVLSRRDA